MLLTMYSEEQHALRLLREGASAFIQKDSPPEDLLAAIRKVAAGGTYITPALVEQMVRQGGRATAPHHTLTAREQEVFSLIIRGRSVTEIATAIDVSASTVSNHLRAIKDKLGVKNTGEVLQYAWRAGLLG